MRILHTSDWHIGRTFHEHSTLEAVRTVLAAIPVVVRERNIDVVLVAGDVYDVANPSAEAVKVFQEAVLAILETGAKVIMTSGNHDSAPRLGVVGAFSSASGLHVLTNPESIPMPVELADDDGPVDVYGIPYLQPELIRRVNWVPTGATSQNEVIRAAMDQVRASIATRESAGRRSVVLSHTFVAGRDEEPFAERRISKPLVAGGVDSVPVSAFDSVHYAALGHIHGRAELAPTVRYSGAILHYSFKEAGKPRGGWLVDLGPTGAEIEWVDLPVPRPLKEIRARLDELLTDSAWDSFVDYYVRAVYTDTSRQLEPMQKLKARFPWCAEVVHEPSDVAAVNRASYRDRIKGKSDPEIVETFLVHVRNGDGPSPVEVVIMDEVIAEFAVEVQSR